MLRILKDCRICGVSIHAGETFPENDFKEADVQVIVGAGFAELFTQNEPEDAIAEEPEDFEIAPVRKTPEKAVEASEDAKPVVDTTVKKTPAKTAKKKAKK